MALLTYLQGVHAVFVRANDPDNVKLVEIQGEAKYTVLEDDKDPDKAKSYTKKDFKAVITEDPAADPFPTTSIGGKEVHKPPLMHNRKGLGVTYAIVLVLVIVITNVHLRGLWSLIAIIVIVMGSIILALSGWWDEIFTRGRLLAVHINMGTYLFISTALFIVWVVNFFFFDRQHYVAVTAGQVRLKLMIGEGEIVYDTTGMVFQKQRSDLFRHYVLGFGSGDLVIRPAGGKDPIDLPNVLFVGSKVHAIQELIKEKEIVAV
jgi:hypothetical protein